MANKKLDYISTLYNLMSELSGTCESRAEDEDTGENSTKEQAVKLVIPMADGFISSIEQFKKDAVSLSFKELQAKY